MLASLESMLVSHFAMETLKLEHDLLGSLSLLVEDGFGLTSETLLFTIVTPLTLSIQTCLAGLVLSNLVFLMVLAISMITVRLDLFREIDLYIFVSISSHINKRLSR